jgi:histidinol phosphatase-like enzyme (inositol monophosphatase family)
VANTPPQQVITRLAFAVEIAREAGAVTLRYFRRHDLVVEKKADKSPVTIADRSAEELLRERIGERFPDDGMIGEEFGTTSGTSGYEWTLDPIDGTKAFIHGIPLYTTLIAVLQDDHPCLGVIHAPATQETVYAARGGGCWYVAPNGGQPQRVHVSNVKSLGDGLLLTSEIEGFREHRRADAMDVFMRLQRAARVARTWGDGYGYLMVATGRAEVMIDPVMNLWDAAPLQPIIEEAGGHFSDWQGHPTVRAGEALATNGLVRDEVLALTRHA